MRERRDGKKLAAKVRSDNTLRHLRHHVEGVGYISEDDAQAAIRILACAGVLYAARLTESNALSVEAEALGNDFPHVKTLISTEKGAGYPYLRYLRKSNIKELPVFFLVEDEWALRQIASRPGYSTIRLLDNLLFLNGPFCSAIPKLQGVPQLEDFGNPGEGPASGNELMKYVPSWRHRFTRYRKYVLWYLEQGISQDLKEDSLGFRLE